VSKIEANRVYLVARYGETHMGRARFHTQGAWLNVENAREAARQANAQLIKHNTAMRGITAFSTSQRRTNEQLLPKPTR